MRTSSGECDWAATSDQARLLGPLALKAVIDGLGEELETTDEIDRATGRCAGGIIRDEISVYRQELERRKRGELCEKCGRGWPTG